MGWWFFGRKGVEEVRDETKKGFESVKKDISSISSWVEHLNSEKKLHKKEIDEIKDILATVKTDLEDVKNFVSALGEIKIGRVLKQNKQVLNKQTAVYSVQTAVQTAVQTPNFEHFSITERAILWLLLNTDMKLGYEDLATMLGKEKSTIRGQLNALKRKSEGLIEEVIEKNGKKRVFIPENMKEKMLKKAKVRVKSQREKEER